MFLFIREGPFRQLGFAQAQFRGKAGIGMNPIDQNVEVRLRFVVVGDIDRLMSGHPQQGGDLAGRCQHVVLVQLLLGMPGQ